MDAVETIWGILQKQGLANPRAVAILAPDRTPLTFDVLSRHVEDNAARLGTLGFCRTERVAMVLPNGPEMATAFLAVASVATSAPFNPDYRASEFEFYLSDLRATALIIQDDLDSPAREVARALDIPVIELTARRDLAASLFRLNAYQWGSIRSVGLLKRVRYHPGKIRQDSGLATRWSTSGREPSSGCGQHGVARNRAAVCRSRCRQRTRGCHGSIRAESRCFALPTARRAIWSTTRRWTGARWRRKSRHLTYQGTSTRSLPSLTWCIWPLP